MVEIALDQLRTRSLRWQRPIRELRGWRAKWRRIRLALSPAAQQRRETVYLLECRARLKIACWLAEEADRRAFLTMHLLSGEVPA